RHAQGRVDAVDLNGLDMDQAAQRLLQGSLDQELRGSCELLAVGREHQLREPGAEGRPVHALARRGEQHLLNQVADVIVGAGRLCGAAAAIEAIGECDVGHVPLTLAWTIMTLSGVLVGVHSDWLSCSSTGAPSAFMRVAPLIHCAVAHGGFGVPVSAQPATAYCVVWTTTGWPMTLTRAIDAAGCAWPGGCAHRIVAPRWSR